jgi:hypothetical protein
VKGTGAALVATHGWAERSCELLGLGTRAFRKVAVEADDRVDIGARQAAIQADRAAREGSLVSHRRRV